MFKLLIVGQKTRQVRGELAPEGFRNSYYCNNTLSMLMRVVQSTKTCPTPWQSLKFQAICKELGSIFLDWTTLVCCTEVHTMVHLSIYLYPDRTKVFQVKENCNVLSNSNSLNSSERARFGGFLCFCPVCPDS